MLYHDEERSRSGQSYARVNRAIQAFATLMAVSF